MVFFCSIVTLLLTIGQYTQVKSLVTTYKKVQFSHPRIPVRLQQQQRVINARHLPSRSLSTAHHKFYSKSLWQTSVIYSVSSGTIEKIPEPLFEGFGKGLLRDYKARLPLYMSDIKDGFNIQVCF